MKTISSLHFSFNRRSDKLCVKKKRFSTREKAPSGQKFGTKIVTFYIDMYVQMYIDTFLLYLLGSDDAVGPSFPTHLLGTRKDPASASGIYSHPIQTGLSTIDEKSINVRINQLNHICSVSNNKILLLLFSRSSFLSTYIILFYF